MANPTLPSDIEFVDEQERAYFAEAMVGEEVRQFLLSDTGRYLHGRAKQEYDRCRDEMFDTDPYTPEGKRKWLKLKADAQAAKWFMRWCVEAIQNGENAEVMLDNYREEA